MVAVTYPFNLTQQPAAAIPCGLPTLGLPVSMQIVGSKYSDILVLRAGHAYEAARPFAIPFMRAGTDTFVITRCRNGRPVGYRLEFLRSQVRLGQARMAAPCRDYARCVGCESSAALRLSGTGMGGPGQDIGKFHLHRLGAGEMLK